MRAQDLVYSGSNWRDSIVAWSSADVPGSDLSSSHDGSRRAHLPGAESGGPVAAAGTVAGAALRS